MKLNKLESKITNKYNYSLFKFSGLESSFGLTLANALSRTLQNDIFGLAITSFSFESKQKLLIENYLHEDILDLIFNLQNVVLKSDYIINTKFDLFAKTSKIYTAEDILFDDTIKIINPKQYLFTKNNNIDFNLILNVETGKGLKTNITKKDVEEGVIFIDAKFSPVIKTSFKIKLETSEENNFNLKETLFFEIWTNKSLTPQRCISEGLKILSKRLIAFLPYDTEEEKEKRKKIIQNKQRYENFIINNLKNLN